MEDDDLDFGEDTIKEVYDKMYNTVFMLMQEHDYPPLAIAGVLMAQAMRLYKTCLEEEDFSGIVNAIVETSVDVEPYDLEHLEVENKTIH